jgi:hypothetical protein
MQGMMHLLEQALGRAQWREAFGAVAAEASSSGDEDALGARKPRYLN